MEKIKSIAIAYDYDDTLSSGNLVEFYLGKLGIDNLGIFQNQVNTLSKLAESNEILAMMRIIVESSRKKGIPITREALRSIGKGMTPFPGVFSWFERINAYASTKGVTIQHFIISSNLRELIEGTPIAKHFTKIFGSGFMYDEAGNACWPALVLDYTAKTQFLFRISKGCLDTHDIKRVNTSFPEEERPIPFSQIVYIGDGETDIPALSVTKQKGGHAFTVYNTEKKGKKELAEALVQQEVAHRSFRADYTEGSEIDFAIKSIIDNVTTYK